MLFRSPASVQMNWRSRVHKLGYLALWGLAAQLRSQGHLVEALNTCCS